MALKEKTILITTWILILLSALVVTAGYTSSNLEMAWLLVWIVIPVVGFMIGVFYALILKLLINLSIDFLIPIVVFSVIVFSALMVEESTIGLIRSQFDSYTERLNAAENLKTSHEVFLGEGKSLYYQNQKDDNFDINFTFLDNSKLSREQILLLAKTWLESKGNVVTNEGELYISPVLYRKEMSFRLISDGKVEVIFSVKGDTKHPEQKNIKMYLKLIYKNGILAFEETGRSYDVSN